MVLGILHKNCVPGCYIIPQFILKYLVQKVVNKFMSVQFCLENMHSHNLPKMGGGLHGDNPLMNQWGPGGVPY